MDKFEYKTERYDTHYTTKVEKGVEVPATVYASELLAMDLPQKGELGWELISLVPQGGSLLAVFKRQGVASAVGPFTVVTQQPQQLTPVPVFFDPNIPVNESETSPFKKPQYTLNVVSGLGSGVRFPVPVAPTTATQAQFPSRDFSTGFQIEPLKPVLDCGNGSCRNPRCASCERG